MHTIQELTHKAKNVNNLRIIKILNQHIIGVGPVKSYIYIFFIF